VIWPMRFAKWNCRACGQEIPLGEERFIDEPDVFAAIHQNCPVLGVFAEAEKP
jgi:hypothetical protein